MILYISSADNSVCIVGSAEGFGAIGKVAAFKLGFTDFRPIAKALCRHNCAEGMFCLLFIAVIYHWLADAQISDQFMEHA